MPKQWAVADIHGCSKTFTSLLSQMGLRKRDTLYILGDLVNKGPNSKGVLDEVLSLIEKGYDLKVLRGNHDQLMIDLAINSKLLLRNKPDFEGQPILDSFGVREMSDVPERYINFLQELPFYFQLRNHLLVHAGFNFSLADPFSDRKSMMTRRRYNVDKGITGGRLIVHGHSPAPVSTIRKNLKKSGLDHLSIDAGCAYMGKKGMGQLLALELDGHRVLTQPNVDC